MCVSIEKTGCNLDSAHLKIAFVSKEHRHFYPPMATTLFYFVTYMGSQHFKIQDYFKIFSREVTSWLFHLIVGHMGSKG